MAKKKTKNTVTTTTVTVTTTTEVDNSKKEQYDFFVLDRSGSMGSIRDVTINGFNEYLQKAKDVAAQTGIKSYCSLLLFDYGNDVDMNDGFIDLCSFVDVNDAPRLTTANYVPRGSTALNDAVARAINALKTRLGSRAGSDDVDVTITVFTDGEENSSKEFPHPGNTALANLVRQVQSDLKWTVTYVGAGSKQQVQYAATSIGINLSNAANYTNDAIGTTSVFRDLSNARGLKSMMYYAGVKSNVDYFAGQTKPDTDTVDNTTKAS